MNLKQFILESLKVRDKTCEELSEESGRKLGYVKQTCGELKADNKIHESAFIAPRKQGRHSPVFSLGAGDPVSPPPRILDKERVTRYRHRYPDRVKDSRNRCVANKKKNTQKFKLAIEQLLPK